ncbi:MAG: haloacid dehalogenase-like hydrolase, partial [Planctomycetes bacterium]|nr:haloacid dehalogenase-like hydrolase [Planctomycetota bacterium]
MMKILVADPLDQQGLKMIEAVEGVTADVKTGLKEDELAAIAGQYDGMIVRSGVKVTAKVLADPGKLRAIQAWASEHAVDLADSWAYSDSFYDLPMLGA